MLDSCVRYNYTLKTCTDVHDNCKIFGLAVKAALQHIGLQRKFFLCSILVLHSLFHDKQQQLISKQTKWLPLTNIQQLPPTNAKNSAWK